MNPLKNLEPAAVFHFFNEICSIPHISHHEKALSDYCVNFAKEHNLSYTQDEMGNVIIFADATPGYEDKETIILQGHLDMVGDKLPDCTIDLENEPIHLTVDGDYISADGTTLGGDDGIAVAYALAILDSEDIPHPRMEVVLTVCEEMGLLGASALDMSACRGRLLINIDSEEEGILTAGCAGGRRVFSHIPVKRTEFDGIRCELTLSGLLGGHSGIEIHKERANSIALLGRFLLRLKKSISFGLLSMSGGVKENVIPKDGKAVILIAPENMSALKQNIEAFLTEMSAEYGTADPNICLSLIEGPASTENTLVSDSLNNILTTLNLMPNGVQAMSVDLPGIVETSLNMGVMELTETELLLRFSIRSSITSAKVAIAEKILHLTESLGGSVEFQGDYPAWPYARESALRNKCIEAFQNQYGREPEIQTIHAGLECGILSDKLPGLDCISFGPDMFDVHTPKERLSISSVARVWEFLKALLAD